MKNLLQTIYKKVLKDEKILLVGIFIIFFVLFWIKSAIFLDPDFGWHISQGELILREGIPKTDPFSYTMPSYPLIIHSYLSEVFIALSFPLIGMFGLAGIVSAVVVLALVFQTYDRDVILREIRQLAESREVSVINSSRLSYVRSNNKFSSSHFFLIPLFLSASFLFMFVAVRPQVITWLFLSILIFVILNKNMWKKWKFFLPLLFILWVNLHGGFGIGILVLTLGVIFKMIEERRINRESIFIVTLSILATFLNPYGMRIWKEVEATIFDISLRWGIAEWLPSIFILHIPLWTLVIISIIFQIRYWRRFSLQENGLYFFLLLVGLSAAKNMPLFIIIALPMTAKSIKFFSEEATVHKYGEKRFKFAYRLFLIFVVLSVFVQAIFDFKDAYSMSEEKFYPKKAVEYLKTKKTHGNIFSDYGWGGYLIWKLPKYKIFIDGRMAIWKRDIEVKGESDNALTDYNKIMSGKVPFKDFANKYNIKTALLSSKIEKKTSIVSKFERWLEKTFPLFRKKKYENVVSQVKKLGWVEVYKDSVVVIYQKK